MICLACVHSPITASWASSAQRLENDVMVEDIASGCFARAKPRLIYVARSGYAVSGAISIWSCTSSECKMAGASPGSGIGITAETDVGCAKTGQRSDGTAKEMQFDGAVVRLAMR